MLSPVKVSIYDKFQSSVLSWDYVLQGDFSRSPSISLSHVRLQIINFSHLHLCDQAAVVGLPQVTLQIEGTTDSSVGDHRFEDLGAVDLLPLPLALPQHVSGVRQLRGGEGVAGQC